MSTKYDLTLVVERLIALEAQVAALSKKLELYVDKLNTPVEVPKPKVVPKK
jgi:hypothetical protein